MFACVHAPGLPEEQSCALVDLAFSFSPRVEARMPDTVLADITGTGYLFGPPEKAAARLAEEARRIHPEPRIAIACNPDAAVHAARSFPGATVIPRGKEREALGFLPLDYLVPSLAGIDEARSAEILSTLRSWGIYRFHELAALPMPGLAERLGPEGVLLQKLAQGASLRALIPVRVPPGYSASADIEHPVDLLEPLLFILGRLVHQVCAGLEGRALAAAELRLRLRLVDGTEPLLPVRLALPMRDPRLFLKLLELEIAKHPPQSPVTALFLFADPARPRVLQKGLFTPVAPEPEKLELLLARIAKLVGPDNAGAPEILDTHRPDAFVMKRFTVRFPGHEPVRKKAECSLGFRIFRPPVAATVDTLDKRPKIVATRPSKEQKTSVRGRVLTWAGPYRTSGDWWDANPWARDEWDVVLSDGGLYCICQDLQSGSWFVAGVYD